jgi:hypothetical protein
MRIIRHATNQLGNCSDEECAKNLIIHQVLQHQKSNQNSSNLASPHDAVEISRSSIKKRSKSEDFEAEKYILQRRILNDRKNSSMMKKRAPIP